MQKTNQTEFRVWKVIKKIGDKFNVKWKGYYAQKMKFSTQDLFIKCDEKLNLRKTEGTLGGKLHALSSIMLICLIAG